MADTNEHLLTVTKGIHGIYPALPGLADSSSSTSSSVYICVKYLHSGLYLKGVCVGVYVSVLRRNHEKLCVFKAKLSPQSHFPHDKRSHETPLHLV